MSDGKAEFEHTTNGAAAPVTKKRKCMRHCARFWWAYLIAFCCIVVLVVCLVIFVGVPNIAQDKINEAELEVQSISILDTESESYTMQVESIIRTDGSIHAEIDGFTGQLYLEGAEPRVPFASLDFPETNADAYQEVSIEQHNEIADMDAFTQFNTWFINNETLQITIEGKTQVQPRGLNRKYGVDFTKTLDVPALNLFRGTKVFDGRVTIDEDDEGYNFRGKADIPNASHFTVEIGNMTFTNFIEDEEIGYLDIQNVTLEPGSNVLDIAGNINQTLVLSYVSSEKYCESGIVPFKLLGDTVERNGQEIGYIQSGLRSANQTVEMDIATIIKDSLDIDIGCPDEESEDSEE